MDDTYQEHLAHLKETNQDALACYRREIQERYGPPRDIPKFDGREGPVAGTVP